ncbi:hypothetical protein MKK75_25390 [Methylobacterium sp. J-030]|uniref:hypothetical protein n=1 Tax=Methylobacterium sp. J-030 TaxID=2836627 RepID=UPI001FB9A182|nr:hypothetical protein [Methylobacterium sp. J-030]MCJ2072093.1 hypothetical protein [Methylobacterium sp. J-030]
MVDGPAVIAAAALYALLLQAFLIDIQSVSPVRGFDGVICAQHDGGGAPADDGLPCQQHACCILAQVAQPLAEIVSVAAVTIALPRRSNVLIWRPLAIRGPRAPPDPAVSSRGPPTA